MPSSFPFIQQLNFSLNCIFYRSTCRYLKNFRTKKTHLLPHFQHNNCFAMPRALNFWSIGPSWTILYMVSIRPLSTKASIITGSDFRVECPCLKAFGDPIEQVSAGDVEACWSLCNAYQTCTAFSFSVSHQLHRSKIADSSTFPQVFTQIWTVFHQFFFQICTVFHQFFPRSGQICTSSGQFQKSTGQIWRGTGPDLGIVNFSERG